MPSGRTSSRKAARAAVRMRFMGMHLPGNIFTSIPCLQGKLYRLFFAPVTGWCLGNCAPHSLLKKRMRRARWKRKPLMPHGTGHGAKTGVFSDAAREARKASAKCAGHRRLQFHAPACDSACRIWGCWSNVTSFSFRAFRFAARCPGTPGQRQRKEQHRPSGGCTPLTAKVRHAGKNHLEWYRIRRTRQMSCEVCRECLRRPALSFPPLRRRLFFGKTKKSGGRNLS